MDVSAKTIERWEQSGVLPSGRLQLQLLAAIQRIVALGLEVYTPEGLAQFMKAPLPTFQYRTALQMIEQGHGDIVYAALAGDYEGLGY